ncbi:Acyl carrier protein [Fasciola hepatica]|uniref:Acyl carrier protein n=1 Tax=Fasciola hepatica TaxID=6192 RepID=A0A4E0RU86_FASHE|nr:Acyl carrier protein [Fasciola hepatica]
MALRIARVLGTGLRPRLFCVQQPNAAFSRILLPYTSHNRNICNTGVSGLPLFSPITRSVKTGLSPEAVTQKVLEVCSAFEKIPADKLNLDSHFMKDLGLDSLDHIEVIMEIENEFFSFVEVSYRRLYEPILIVPKSSVDALRFVIWTKKDAHVITHLNSSFLNKSV